DLITMAVPGDERLQQLAAKLTELDALLNSRQDLTLVLPTLVRLAEKTANAAQALVPAQGDSYRYDLAFWTRALAVAAQSHWDDVAAAAHDAQALNNRLQAVADTARTMAMAMDFTFLLDAERKL